MKKFICTRAWKRNSLGDIIEEWEYNKYPDEIKLRNFKEHVVEPEIVKVPEPVVREHKNTTFKPFSVEDSTESKED